MNIRIRTLAFALALGLSAIVAEARAGDLVNDTKETIVVQKGVRNAQTGVFNWTHQINLLPGNYVKLEANEWYRTDSHVRDTKTTYTLPGRIDPNNRRHYLFLFGNEVRVDVTRP